MKSGKIELEKNGGNERRGWLLSGYEKRSREWEQMALNCNLWCSVPFCDQTVIDFLFEGGSEDFAVNTLKIGSLKRQITVLVAPEEEKELVGVRVCCRVEDSWQEWGRSSCEPFLRGCCVQKMPVQKTRPCPSTS